MIDIIQIGFLGRSHSIWVPVPLVTINLVEWSGRYIGTIQLPSDNDNITKYYLEQTKDSPYKGELAALLDSGGNILDKSQFNFVTIEQLQREEKINQIL